MLSEKSPVPCIQVELHGGKLVPPVVSCDISGDITLVKSPVTVTIARYSVDKVYNFVAIGST